VSTIPEPASAASKIARMAHMRLLVEQLQKLEERLRAGGGPAKVERQHRAGKMTAREAQSFGCLERSRTAPREPDARGYHSG
jgi:hypothetical protein